MGRNLLIPFLIFVFYLLHGSLLGLTDDEAYYWVLAQRPALGYAFHPPGVAWSIAIPQFLFGKIFGTHSAFLVRLPAAFYASSVIAMALYWYSSIGISSANLRKAVLVLLSFAGFFGGAWMMVPDLPLLFGWMVAFVATWEICSGKNQWPWFLALFIGVAISILSKYSGIFVVASCLISLLFWATPNSRWLGWFTIGVAALFSFIPILIWNSYHEWTSILYQVQGRHSGASFSWIRYLKFWGIQAALAGPPIILYFFISSSQILFRRVLFSKVHSYILAWAIPPALIFCIQPIIAEFKPHWTFVVWLPIALALGASWSQGLHQRLSKVQVGYGFTLIAAVFLSCHIPWVSWVLERANSQTPDPRIDVTNDMYGWSELGGFLKSNSLHHLPVVGSRYQTASQAAFALGTATQVTLLPRDLKQKDEWPDLKVTRTLGPEWPELTTPIIFVTDNRYSARPEFSKANCVVAGKIEKFRWRFLAKRIVVWKCDPDSAKAH